MYTRTQYLNHECTLDQYYGQFVNERVKDVVISYIPLSRLKSSKCEHFNDIPLCDWNRIPYLVNYARMKECGDFLTPAGNVCMAKVAARQILEDLK